MHAKQVDNTVRIVVVLDPMELYNDQTPPNQAKSKAHRWAKETACLALARATQQISLNEQPPLERASGNWYRALHRRCITGMIMGRP